MTNESILPKLEEWMDAMTFYASPDCLKRISSNETAMPILTALISYVHPKETVRKAKNIFLTRKQRSQESCKELELMKKRNKLKDQLQRKEKEFTEKKKEYTKLVQEIKNMLQEVQWTICNLTDEKKKLLFLLLNKKALNDTAVQFRLLRNSVHEAKEQENRKNENHCSLQDHNKVREAVYKCQAFIKSTRKRMEVQLETTQNNTSEYGCNGTTTKTLEWKHNIIEFVTKTLENIPLGRVFEVLLEQQQQIVNSIQLTPNSTRSDASLFMSKNCEMQEKSNFEASESMFFVSNYAELNGLTVIKSESDMKQLMNDRTSLSRNGEDSVISRVMEDLKLSENNLRSIENLIAERVVECKHLKICLKANLAEGSRKLFGIKQFCRRLHGMHKDDPQPVLQMNELHSCMEELCNLGPKEIHLFATLPLIALEKLSIDNGKSVPVYELLSHYLRVLSNTSNYSKSSFSVLKHASGLSPHHLLLHVWKQLMYLGELLKANSLMKPFVGTSVNVRVEPEDRSEKLQLIHDNFLSIISQFASLSDDIGTFLEITRHHPLTAVVPKDLLVEGQSIQFYINLFNKAKENVNNFSNITEEYLKEPNVKE